MTDNQKKLREIMDKHNLSYRKVGDLLDRSETTVTSWLRPKGNGSYRTLPDLLINILEMRLNGTYQ